MTEDPLDEVDRQILHLLQTDARNNTNAAISERVGVSASTVGKRIAALESSGTIRGYRPDIDYERAGYPLRVLLICSSPVADRADDVAAIRAVTGVVNVIELMTGEENIHVDVVGRTNEDITRVATAIDDLGIDISEEILVRNVYPRPASVFEDASAPHSDAE